MITMIRNKILFELAFFLLFAVVVNGQRVAPGVPPSQYQNVPVQQQQHQGQPHYQQAPGVAPQQYQQYGQVHYQTQQQQQHIPVQQPPANAVHMQQHQQHAAQGQPPHQHHNAHYEQQVLNVVNIEHEREHIKEHMSVPVNADTMSEHELQFHYFKMHDTDNNNKLDGCELIKSLIHWHEQGHKDPKNPQLQPEPKNFKNEELENLIDPILKMDDHNQDGFIDYPEFNAAQEKAAANQQKQQAGGQ